MTSRPVLIALFLALLLAVGAYFVLKGPGGGGPVAPGNIIPAGEPVLKFDPAYVLAITLRTPTGAQVLDRHENGDWYWRNGQRSLQNYLLNGERMQALLRILTETKSVATPDAKANVPDSPPPVKLLLHLRGGSGGDNTITVRLAPRALGGQVLAEIEHPDQPEAKYAYVPENLLTLLTSPGPSAWRDTRLFPQGASNASRISFTDSTKTKGFTLAKRNGGGGWNLIEPVAAPANPDAVAKLLSTIDGLQITKWFDESLTSESTGLATPSGILTIETDIRGFDTATNRPTSTTQFSTLMLGNPADAGGHNLFATTDSGATIVAIDAVSLGAFAADIAPLISRAASKALPADVGSIEIKAKHTLTLTRQTLANSNTNGGWSEMLDAEAPVTQDATRAAGTEQLLAMLTTLGADKVATAANTNATPLGTITLRGMTGEPLEVIEAFRDGPTALVLRTGKVYRTYTKPAPELSRWLGTLN